ncbi:HEAT repeat domain-containing protein [Rhodococcus sp. NPDC003318]|uniref:HEAT repeat domain-containing protein n=1 Tax=Rhodococcus sp. NPDC003318 TaxID=3364503 RepID=UPI0036989E8A
MISDERAALDALDEGAIPQYLDAHSHLPGPRANLALVGALTDVAPPELAFALADDPDEFRRLCGTAALGRLLTGDDGTALAVVESRAAEGFWRVREGAAMALQRLGDDDPAALRRVVSEWSAHPDPLVARAAVAGICEPRLLADAQTALAALDACAAATDVLRRVPAQRRREPDVRTLRKGLGYCWSVAVAGDPDTGLPRFAALSDDPDPDVRWIVRENRRKARLRRLLPD